MTEPERDDDLAHARTLHSNSEGPDVLLLEEPKAGDVLDGKYELERVLGEGGMGKVWKGVHLGLGVPVAVKTLRPEVAAKPDYARRFRREAHAASLLSHPNVVRVLDFGDHHGTLYMVMEYLVGRPLADRVEAPEPMPLAEVASTLASLCDACELAHSFGIVHRDLKPENVLLTGEGRTVKVVDFGLAHVDDARDQGPTLTSSDVIAGTPEYMSPEQCRSLAVGPSADVYALGCILTAMLQGRPPFVGSSSIEILAKQMFAQPPPLARPDAAEPVPPLLERLRLDLLAKVPEDRPRDAADVRARLAEAMSAEATLARLPTRKGDEPLGDRAARAPDWRAPRGGDTIAYGKGKGVVRRDVGLLRVASRYAGVDEEIATGLAAYDVDLRAMTDARAVPPAAAAVVVDAGDRLDGALAALEAVRAAAPGTPVLVCAAGLDTDGVNALVAAGAADVLRYPVATDKLARKLSRVIRHGR